MEKYHPVHSKKREDLALAAVKKRLEVWQQLTCDVPLCVDEASKLEAYLDQVVAKLEGGENQSEEGEELHKTSSIFLMPSMETPRAAPSTSRSARCAAPSR